jgi:CspA family cold shock protein
MPKGVIRFFNEWRGYGFIEEEDAPGQSRSSGVFVHHSQIVDGGYRTLEEGAAVAYELGEGIGGPIAVNVHKLP